MWEACENVAEIPSPTHKNKSAWDDAHLAGAYPYVSGLVGAQIHVPQVEGEQIVQE